MANTLDPSRLVRRARERAHLSQRVLAQRAGTSQSVVARIESGLTDPRSATLARILAAAGFEVRGQLEALPVTSSHMLNDVPRILGLTPEQRLVEVANVARFEESVRHG